MSLIPPPLLSPYPPLPLLQNAIIALPPTGQSGATPLPQRLLPPPPEAFAPRQPSSARAGDFRHVSFQQKPSFACQLMLDGSPAGFHASRAGSLSVPMLARCSMVADGRHPLWGQAWGAPTGAQQCGEHRQRLVVGDTNHMSEWCSALSDEFSSTDVSTTGSSSSSSALSSEECERRGGCSARSATVKSPLRGSSPLQRLTARQQVRAISASRSDGEVSFAERIREESARTFGGRTAPKNGASSVAPSRRRRVPAARSPTSKEPIQSLPQPVKSVRESRMIAQMPTTPAPSKASTSTPQRSTRSPMRMFNSSNKSPVRSTKHITPQRPPPPTLTDAFGVHEGPLCAGLLVPFSDSAAELQSSGETSGLCADDGGTRSGRGVGDNGGGGSTGISNGTRVQCSSSVSTCRAFPRHIFPWHNPSCVLESPERGHQSASIEVGTVDSHTDVAETKSAALAAEDNAEPLARLFEGARSQQESAPATASVRTDVDAAFSADDACSFVGSCTSRGSMTSCREEKPTATNLDCTTPVVKDNASERRVESEDGATGETSAAGTCDATIQHRIVMSENKAERGDSAPDFLWITAEDSGTQHSFSSTATLPLTESKASAKAHASPAGQCYPSVMSAAPAAANSASVSALAAAPPSAPPCRPSSLQLPQAPREGAGTRQQVISVSSPIFGRSCSSRRAKRNGSSRSTLGTCSGRIRGFTAMSARSTMETTADPRQESGSSCGFGSGNVVSDETSDIWQTFAEDDAAVRQVPRTPTSPVRARRPNRLRGGLSRRCRLARGWLEGDAGPPEHAVCAAEDTAQQHRPRQGSSGRDVGGNADGGLGGVRGVCGGGSLSVGSETVPKAAVDSPLKSPGLLAPAVAPTVGESEIVGATSEAAEKKDTAASAAVSIATAGGAVGGTVGTCGNGHDTQPRRFSAMTRTAFSVDAARRQMLRNAPSPPRNTKGSPAAFSDSNVQRLPEPRGWLNDSNSPGALRLAAASMGEASPSIPELGGELPLVRRSRHSFASSAFGSSASATTSAAQHASPALIAPPPVPLLVAQADTSSSPSPCRRQSRGSRGARSDQTGPISDDECSPSYWEDVAGQQGVPSRFVPAGTCESRGLSKTPRAEDEAASEICGNASLMSQDVGAPASSAVHVGFAHGAARRVEAVRQLAARHVATAARVFASQSPRRPVAARDVGGCVVLGDLPPEHFGDHDNTSSAGAGASSRPRICLRRNACVRVGQAAAEFSKIIELASQQKLVASPNVSPSNDDVEVANDLYGTGLVRMFETHHRSNEHGEQLAPAVETKPRLEDQEHASTSSVSTSVTPRRLRSHCVSFSAEC
eukprot:TRINITY_DN4395_c1_g1_i1.p1 TRINITY_DN4395_c1_g1~~TRINITY_DN4395_c1_g1_i1.p1  ORF type:complete len:1330 (+),score=207.94 TRINITY_DN4395_c1_g1_i1:62-4051(+)